MSQTLAILHDGYREINSRKMFWVSLILSGLVVASFAAALFCVLKRVSSSCCKEAGRPFFSDASNAFMVGP